MCGIQLVFLCYAIDKSGLSGLIPTEIGKLTRLIRFYLRRYTFEYFDDNWTSYPISILMIKPHTLSL